MTVDTCFQLNCPPPSEKRVMPKYRVESLAGRGRALVAVEDIHRGERVLEEPAVFNASNGKSGGKAQGSANSSEYDMDYLERQVALLCPEDLALFLALHDPQPSGPPALRNQRIYCNNTYRDGLFLTASRMNHSCWPNVLLSSADGLLGEVVALRDIPAGEEITVSYLRASHLETRQERAAKLQELWQFQCCCRLCSLPGQEARENDLAREKTRYTLDRVARLFDSLWKANSKVTRQVAGPLLRSYTQQALEAVRVLETELEGQADTALLLGLQQLAELAAFSCCGRFVVSGEQGREEVGEQGREEVGGEGREEVGESAEHYLGLARGVAGGLGLMFLSNCGTVEREIRELEVDFG